MGKICTGLPLNELASYVGINRAAHILSTTGLWDCVSLGLFAPSHFPVTFLVPSNLETQQLR